ncbi:MAG: hypothetical protein M3O35_06630 [Acidobacteriota bacterium]|nr:hypothetical protein [Acidobacteriota bacterium]
MSLQDALTDARETAREAILHGFDDRFAQLETRIAGRFEESRRELAARLNQAVRRLRRFDNGRALVDAAGPFCGRAMFFEVAGRNLATAPAFAHAVESGDPVVCMRTRGELSAEFATLVGEAPDRKCHLFPISTGERVVAILYADSDTDAIETEALELLATVAGSVIRIAPPKSSALDLKARRFARVRVARLRLHKSAAVKMGRANCDLYASLREEIDADRDAFRRDFLSRARMVDHYHTELLQTLAHDNPELLGEDYPGPLAR